MIRLSDPSLALHSFDVPGYKYRMWQTRKLSKYTNPTDIVNEIMWAIDNSPEMYLDNVVINCHGNPGRLYIGAKEKYLKTSDTDVTINIGNVGVFAPLKKKGKLGTIWLVACKVAKGADGSNFCAEMARAAGCNVVGADKIQRVNFGFYLQSCPDHCIDKFEGTAYRFDADGNKEVYSN